MRPTTIRSALAGAALIAAAALGLAGCAASGDGPGASAPASAEPPVSTSPASTPPESSASFPPAVELSPRDDLVHEHVIEWSEVERVSDRETRLGFTIGTETCYGVRVAVRETADAVEIAVIEGTLPERADSACIQIVQFATVLVTTDTPIGDRALRPLDDVELHA